MEFPLRKVLISNGPCFTRVSQYAVIPFTHIHTHTHTHTRFTCYTAWLHIYARARIACTNKTTIFELKSANTCLSALRLGAVNLPSSCGLREKLKQSTWQETFFNLQRTMSRFSVSTIPSNIKQQVHNKQCKAIPSH